MTAERIEISAEEAEALLTRVKGSLPEEDYRIIKGLVDTHLLLNQAVNEKSISIKRLLKMIFGAKTEKSGSGRNTSGSRKRGRELTGNEAPEKSCTRKLLMSTMALASSAIRACIIAIPVLPAKMAGSTDKGVPE